MSLQIKPDATFGIPYGSIPRILLLWIADEVRRTKDPRLFLGDNLSRFMEQLDIVPTGGRWGTVTSLKNQMHRLFNADIRFRWADEENSKGKLFAIQDYDLWWTKTNSSDPKQSDLWRSQIVLTDPLFEELLTHSAPVDMRVIKVLRRSPMELDVYCWLTYRMAYLERPLFLPYKTLEKQFGSHYKDPWDFKINLNKALWSVLKQYPKARVQPDIREGRVDGWKLLPSPPHVPRDPFKSKKLT